MSKPNMILPDGTIYCGSVFPAKPILVYLKAEKKYFFFTILKKGTKDEKNK